MVVHIFHRYMPAICHIRLATNRLVVAGVGGALYYLPNESWFGDTKLTSIPKKPNPTNNYRHKVSDCCLKGRVMTQTSCHSPFDSLPYVIRPWFSTLNGVFTCTTPPVIIMHSKVLFFPLYLYTPPFMEDSFLNWGDLSPFACKLSAIQKENLLYLRPRKA
jgi:hypothetical protein